MRTRDIRPQPGKDQRPGKLTPVTAPRRTPPDSALRLFQVEVANAGSLQVGNKSSLRLASATISDMPCTGPSQSPADMLRRIRELEAAGPGLGHITEQQLISKVLLKRFVEPSGPHRGLICPFRLEFPRASLRLVGPDGCAKVDNFVAWASASVERLWKETEDRLPDALAAMDADTLFGNAEHMSVIKSAIALHFARSKAARVIHARVWAETVERGRCWWMTENRRLLAYWFYREKGLYPAGDEALRIFADEIMELSFSLADSGTLWRERIESLYVQARTVTDAAGLEIVTPADSGEFLIGDVPALTVRGDRSGVGVLGGIALAEAQSVFLPLGRRHAAALGRVDRRIHLTSDQVAEVNARQLRGAIDYVYLRPGSPLMDTVRSFAETRKSTSRAAA